MAFSISVEEMERFSDLCGSRLVSRLLFPKGHSTASRAPPLRVLSGFENLLGEEAPSQHRQLLLAPGESPMAALLGTVRAGEISSGSETKCRVWWGPKPKLTERILGIFLASTGDCVGVVLMLLGPSEIRKKPLATVAPVML